MYDSKKTVKVAPKTIKRGHVLKLGTDEYRTVVDIQLDPRKSKTKIFFNYHTPIEYDDLTDMVDKVDAI